VRSIRDGNCTAFLGAAVNYSKDAGKGLPLGAEVSKLLAEDIDQKKEKIVDPGNLAKVSLVYECLVDRTPLIQAVKGHIPDRQREPSSSLRILAKLPIDLYVTTNYDRLLEDALIAAMRPPFVVVQTPDGIHGVEHVSEWLNQPKDSPEERAAKRPLVYKIHGTFFDPRKDENGMEIDDSALIITESDYIDFLTLLGSGSEESVPPTITGRFGINTLLFLGYSLEDWDFRVIYKIALRKAINALKLPHYSVQVGVADHWRNYWLGKSEQRLRIFDIDVHEFAAKLEKAWEGPDA